MELRGTSRRSLVLTRRKAANNRSTAWRKRCLRRGSSKECEAADVPVREWGGGHSESSAEIARQPVSACITELMRAVTARVTQSRDNAPQLPGRGNTVLLRGEWGAACRLREAHRGNRIIRVIDTCLLSHPVNFFAVTAIHNVHALTKESMKCMRRDAKPRAAGRCTR